MIYTEMTKNYIFRELKCQLSIQETAKLCFKSVRTVKGWDEGKDIPRECRRLMRLHSKTVANRSEEWEEFQIENGKLVLPTGQRLSPNQVLIGAALLNISSDIERKTCVKLLGIARKLAQNKLV